MGSELEGFDGSRDSGWRRREKRRERFDVRRNLSSRSHDSRGDRHGDHDDVHRGKCSVSENITTWTHHSELWTIKKGKRETACPAPCPPFILLIGSRFPFVPQDVCFTPVFLSPHLLSSLRFNQTPSLFFRMIVLTVLRYVTFHRHTCERETVGEPCVPKEWWQMKNS